jgi:hypothetical protein
MKRLCILAMLCMSGCAYSHVASTNATFAQSDGGNAPELVLRISRHLDTVLSAPDSEEDQLLELVVRRPTIGERRAIPSDTVTPRFQATRFGPASIGTDYHGFLRIREISTNRVVAIMKLKVTASTPESGYTQKAVFNDKFIFVRP